MGVQVLAYELIKDYDSEKKVKKIIDIVKKGDIVMLEGRLTPEEDLNLTSKALESVSGKFSGIEVAYISSTTANSFVDKLKNRLLKVIASDRIGITVVGPSKIIKEIKMNPSKLEILFRKN